MDCKSYIWVRAFVFFGKKNLSTGQPRLLFVSKYAMTCISCMVSTQIQRD